jgi:two-component system, chemotaxis family, protein-glutamate methylesterase/glutaminase
VAGHEIVVIGASSGGVEALTKIAGDLPPDLPAAVFVVLHFPQDAPSVLPRILSRAGPLEAVHPTDGEPVERGRIYVAPPDFHLLLQEDRVRITRGPRENRHRPAVDPLFRTAALAYGPRVVGVVLTGARNDGTAGLQAVKQRGGVAVVQDPEEALFSGMPESALEYVSVDHCVPLEKIAVLLARLAREPAEEEGAYPLPDDMELESKIAGLDPSVLDSDKRPGELSHFTCPECAGPLYEMQQDDLIRFRCRVGHAYTAESMLDEKSEELEQALYVALNTLEENALMADRLANRSRQHGHGHAVSRFEQRAEEARQQAKAIRRVLTQDAPEAV